MINTRLLVFTKCYDLQSHSLYPFFAKIASGLKDPFNTAARIQTYNFVNNKQSYRDLPRKFLKNCRTSMFQNTSYSCFVILHFTYSWKKIRWCRSLTLTISDTWSSFKMMKNTSYFILKCLFVLKIFKFLSWLFGHVDKRLD